MDDEIGRVVEALERRKMRENTLIIFHSDNGGTRSAMFTGESAVEGPLPPTTALTVTARERCTKAAPGSSGSSIGRARSLPAW